MSSLKDAFSSIAELCITMLRSEWCCLFPDKGNLKYLLLLNTSTKTYTFEFSSYINSYIRNFQSCSKQALLFWKVHTSLLIQSDTKVVKLLDVISPFQLQITASVRELPLQAALALQLWPTWLTAAVREKNQQIFDAL